MFVIQGNTEKKMAISLNAKLRLLLLILILLTHI